MSSKNERAARARAQAQAQIRAKERRTTLIIVAASVVALGLFGALVFFIVNQGDVPELGAEGATSPAGSDTTGGVPVGTGGVVGEDVPTDAPRVDVYLDFMCPICGTFEDTNAGDLEELRANGDIQLYYHPISILDRYSNGTEFSTRSAAAAGVIADQAPEAFDNFVTQMFVNQPAEGTDGLSNEQITQIAIAAGAPEDVAGAIDDADFRKWATAATEQSRVDGVTGTPSIRVSETGDFADGVILNSSDDSPTVNYFEPGVLREYLEGLG